MRRQRGTRPGRGAAAPAQEPWSTHTRPGPIRQRRIEFNNALEQTAGLRKRLRRSVESRPQLNAIR